MEIVDEVEAGVKIRAGAIPLGMVHQEEMVEEIGTGQMEIGTSGRGNPTHLMMININMTNTMIGRERVRVEGKERVKDRMGEGMEGVKEEEKDRKSVV